MQWLENSTAQELGAVTRAPQHKGFSLSSTVFSTQFGDIKYRRQKLTYLEGLQLCQIVERDEADPVLPNNSVLRRNP